MSLYRCSDFKNNSVEEQLVSENIFMSEMVLAIDSGARSAGYVKAAEKLNIKYKLVDCLASDIIKQLEDAYALIWHWKHTDYAEKRVARQIIAALEKKGTKVYPDSNTCGTFDDKIAQKYLLEALNLPITKSEVFFDRKSAEDYLKTCSYPLVTKLAGGAGSSNVGLIKNESEGLKAVKKRFDSYYHLGYNWGNIKNPRSAISYYVKADNERLLGEDKGYIYFQEFLPDNTYDIRVSIIAGKAVIFRRYVRDNDFRASGSGKIDYVVSDKDMGAIEIAYRVADALDTQTIALDFAYDTSDQHKIIEISYGFVSKAVSDAGCYYDRELNKIDEAVVVEEEVVKLLAQ